MTTYAILDAAIVQLLPELLEQSGLPHKCLFTGDALDDHGAHGPWMVELAPGSDFTRNLFTHAPGHQAGWQLWGRNAGLFVQSQKGFDAVWSHMRKLVRVKDADDNWFLFRFWEPQIAGAFWPAYPNDEAEVARRFGPDIVSAVFWQDGAAMDCVHLARAPAHIASQRNLITAYQPLMRKARWARFCGRVDRAARASLPSETAALDRLQIEEICGKARAAGYRREKAIFDYVCACVICRAKGIQIEKIRQHEVKSARFPDDLTAARRLRQAATDLQIREMAND